MSLVDRKSPLETRKAQPVLYVLVPLHVIICIFLILVVLLQQGKGADLSVFGGGSTQTAFGARGATTLLHKLTVTSFVLFIATTMLIGIFQSDSGGSILRGENLDDTAATVPAEPDSMPASESEELLESPSDAPAPAETPAGDTGLGEVDGTDGTDGGDDTVPPSE